MTAADSELQSMWSRHAAEWRDTAQITSQWSDAAAVDPKLLRSRARGAWWDTLDSLGVTLFITREYEHLVLALSVDHGRPRISFLPMPHPSGLAVDRAAEELFIASTRNPNQIFSLRPARSFLPRSDVRVHPEHRAVMMPAASRYYPGSLYLHDLALVGSTLHGNAVGHNAVVRFNAGGGFDYRWWPKCVEHRGQPVHHANYIQLNSIAAGKTLRDSFFTASSNEIGLRRPGHLNFPVDRRGVIFSGRTREPLCTGLTRPHSARLHPTTSQLWVANSGYGEVGFISDGRLEVVRRLPGWTRGLCLIRDVVFVATSRIIPRFACYAPGLDPGRSRSAIFALHRKTGEILGSLEWPAGNQVFAIDWIRRASSPGFPFEAPLRRRARERHLFYTYRIS